MRRRDLMMLLGGTAFMAPVLARAQAQHVRRVGVLAPGPLRPIASFKQRLKELGWVEGETIEYEARWGAEDDSRYASFAAELAALPVDVFLTWSTPAALAAKQATTKIPIVMGAIADPVAAGVVTELAHPGSNITGFSSQNFELEEKRFELLRELAPSATRIVMLGNAGNPYSALALKHINKLATSAGLNFEGINIDESGGLENGLERLRRAYPDGVLVPGVPALLVYRKPIADFMAVNRIPAVYPWPEFAEAGGLAVYSTNFDDLFRQAAGYVDKVLRGVAPGELAVQQAATFELVINMRAAKALELTIPPVLLVRADEVIE